MRLARLAQTVLSREADAGKPAFARAPREAHATYLPARRKMNRRERLEGARSRAQIDLNRAQVTMIAVRCDDAQFHPSSVCVCPARDRGEMGVEHDEWSARRQRRADCGLAAEFAAQ